VLFDNSVAVELHLIKNERQSSASCSVASFCRDILHEPEREAKVTHSLFMRQWVCSGSNLISSRSAQAGRGGDQCGQATKGVWGMSWRQEAMKGVEDCDKLGGAVKRALIPRSLNYPVVNP
jgi:hypothetical protein